MNTRRAANDSVIARVSALLALAGAEGCVVHDHDGRRRPLNPWGIERRFVAESKFGSPEYKARGGYRDVIDTDGCLSPLHTLFD